MGSHATWAIMDTDSNIFFVGINIEHGCVTVKARLLVVVTDLPAKAAIMNIMQFNGEFGCPVCLHKGEQVRDTQSVYDLYNYDSVCVITGV